MPIEAVCSESSVPVFTALKLQPFSSILSPGQSYGCTGEPVPDGKYLALQLTFALPVSSYATMLVRELLKSTTSNIEHREMTKADELEAAAAATEAL